MKEEMEDMLNTMFKEGLSEPDHLAEYREEDWDALEELLNAKQKKRTLLFWLPLIGGIAASLLLVSAWLFLKPNFTKNTQKAVKLTHTHKNLLLTPKQQQLAETKQTQTGNTDISSAHAQNLQNTTLHSLVHNDASTLGIAKSKLKNGFTLPIAYRDTIEGSKSTVYTFRNTETLTSTGLQNLDGLSLNEALAIRSLDVTPPALIPPPASGPVTASSIKQRTTNRPQFAFTVIAGNDINGVSSFQQSKVGTDLGLLFSAQISKKFTLSTGAIYAKKPYMTTFSSSYTTGYYQTQNNLQVVSADCRVLDIPLNLDYQLYHKAKNKISIGTGLSSYLMLRESYHYIYSNPYTQGSSDYTLVNENQHFLGVLNLDATYQRQLNSKIGIDLQPYLKIPLTNIGYSKVKLQSAGVAVGISWNINSLSKH